MENGHCLNGAYWCGSSPLIIVDQISRERIEQVIDELIKDNAFEYVFKYFGAVEERSKSDYESDFFNSTAKINPSYVYAKASQLKEMLDQASDELRESIMKEIFGVTP